jgi:hypothetical protein
MEGGVMLPAPVLDDGTLRVTPAWIVHGFVPTVRRLRARGVPSDELADDAFDILYPETKLPYDVLPAEDELLRRMRMAVSITEQPHYRQGMTGREPAWFRVLLRGYP